MSRHILKSKKTKSSVRQSQVKKIKDKKIRYAVVGLGHIAQMAILPAFEHAKENSELVALVTGDQQKHKLASKYKAHHVLHYNDLENYLAEGHVDAIYISLPNSLHRPMAEMAARLGVHILCEKPLAVTSKDARSMIEVAEQHHVHLMTAYRLHFERANLQAIEIANSGKLGDLKFFSSVFCMRVRNRNIRLQAQLGGGTLYDIGIYCINAARYLFRSEPFEVMAMSTSSRDRRFSEVDETTSAILRFPNSRIASFTTNFSGSPRARYELIGTEGSLSLENSYEYADQMTMEIKSAKGITKKKKFAKRDQFAAELSYFSDCILKNKKPEPDGWEGYKDVQIIEALYESAHTGRAILLNLDSRAKRPTLRQEKYKPAVQKPNVIHVQSPSLD